MRILRGGMLVLVGVLFGERVEHRFGESFVHPVALGSVAFEVG